MKMSKSLIITSLLFSSMILSPSTIAGITAQAAETAGQGTTAPKPVATTDYTFKFVDQDGKQVEINKAPNGKDSVFEYKVTLPSSTQISLKTIPVATPNGYRDADVQDLAPTGDNHTVTIKLVKTKKVSVQLKDWDKPINNLNITVDNTAELINPSEIKLPKGYVILNKKNDFKITQNSTSQKNEATVYITKQNFHNISVTFMNGINQVHVYNSTISVPEGVENVDKSYIDVPKHYKLDDNNKFRIIYRADKNNPKKLVGHVVVNVVPSDEDSSNSNNSSNTNKPSTAPGSSHASNGSSATNMHTTTVNFVDENGNTVSSSKATGATGDQKTVSLPDGYKLAAGETNDITIGKSDNTVTVKVVKGSAEGEITSHKTVVTSTDVATLYSKEGKQLKGRALSANSNWAVDKQLVLNGTTYYRVATDEWVKANDVYEFASVNKSITTASDSAKTLYTSNGNVIKNRGLAAGSAWHTDKVATINGKQMYRVATNEWVLASDLA